MRCCLKCSSDWIKYWRTLNSALWEGRMCQDIDQATFKNIFLDDLVASLKTTNVPGKQCKIKHTFVFIVAGQSEAYRPCTACSTLDYGRSLNVVSLRVKSLQLEQLQGPSWTRTHIPALRRPELSPLRGWNRSCRCYHVLTIPHDLLNALEKRTRATTDLRHRYPSLAQNET